METPVLGYGPNLGESHICRLCMKSHAYYLNVFASSEQFKMPIGKVIEDLLMLEVAEGDSLPATVCCPCVTKLMDFREFKEMCVYSARELSRSEPFPCPVKVEIIEEDETVEPCAGSGLADWSDEFVKDGSGQSVLSKGRIADHENDGADGNGEEDGNNVGRGVVVKKEYDEGATVFIESAAVAMREECLVDEEDVERGADDGVVQSVVVKREYGDGATVFIESSAVEMRDECDVVDRDGGMTTRVVKRVAMDKLDSDEDYVPPGGVDPLNVGQTVDDFEADSDGSEYSPEGGKKKKNRRNASTISRSLSKHLKCDTCGKLFGRRSHLKRHTLLHTGEKPHQCHLCGKSFAVLGYLRTHVASHAKKKPPESDAAEDPEPPSGIPTVGPAPKGTLSSTDFECHICGKLFKQRCNVKRHVLLHTGLKPHKCHVCGKAFVDVFNLREHEAIHLGLTLVPRRVPGGLIDPSELSICRSYK